MSDWSREIGEALRDFETVAHLASYPMSSSDLDVRYLPAPHRPEALPPGWMAVYGFWHAGVWLKIGIAGPKSGPRFSSHHYNLSAPSSLSKSLANDPAMLTQPGFDPKAPGAWTKENTFRVEILMPSHYPIALLSLLEAFLHLRMRPRYEGKQGTDT